MGLRGWRRRVCRGEDLAAGHYQSRLPVLKHAQDTSVVFDVHKVTARAPPGDEHLEERRRLCWEHLEDNRGNVTTGR
jgi:hypothetical protein